MSAATDHPSLSADDLGALAAALLRGGPLAEHPRPPLLIALPWGDPWRVDDEGADLLVREVVDPAHVLELLADPPPGEETDPAWLALGLLADGWQAPEAGLAVDHRTGTRLGGPLREHPDRVRVRMLHLVARSGASALGLRAEGADPVAHTTEDGGAPGGPVGPAVEAMRRAFDLPTPPCDARVIELHACSWLRRVLVVGKMRHRVRRSWRLVSELHPGWDLFAERRDLVEVGEVHAARQSWDALRLECIAGSWGTELVTDKVARFADAPMFARLALRSVPPLWFLVSELASTSTPAVVDGVLRTLAAWDLAWDPPRAEAAAGPAA